jgi:large repetitive protein
MARNPHTILGGLALGAGLLLASAAPAAALTPLPDDDGPGLAPNNPLVSIGDAHAYEADGSIQFPITLSKASGQITFVTVQRTNGSTSNADFTGFAAPVAIIPPHSTTGTISFPLVDDDATEDPESMIAEITNVTGSLVVNDGEANGTVYDADGPVLGATMDQVSEGDPGDDVSLAVEASLSYPVPEDITFTLQTQVVGFGAVPGDDFEPVDDTFTIPAGSSSVVVPIAVVSDDVVDDDDGVVMAIASDPSRGSTWDNTAVGKILDDDTAGDGSGTGDGSGESGVDDETAVGTPGTTSTTSSTSTTDPTDDGEVAMATSAGADGDDGSGPPFLPIAGLVIAGFAAAWWLFGRRDDDATDTALVDPTGTIDLG